MDTRGGCGDARWCTLSLSKCPKPSPRFTISKRSPKAGRKLPPSQPSQSPNHPLKAHNRTPNLPILPRLRKHAENQENNGQTGFRAWTRQCLRQGGATEFVHKKLDVSLHTVLSAQACGSIHSSHWPSLRSPQSVVVAFDNTEHKHQPHPMPHPRHHLVWQPCWFSCGSVPPDPRPHPCLVPSWPPPLNAYRQIREVQGGSVSPGALRTPAHGAVS